MVSLLEKLEPEKKISGSGPENGCPQCGEKIFWMDRYGNGPHCKKCRPWPNRSLVSKIFGEQQESTEQEKKTAEEKNQSTDFENLSPEEFERMFTWYETKGDRNGNGKRLVIQRKDWKDSWSMIVRTS
jgi:hypothetical protein